MPSMIAINKREQQHRVSGLFVETSRRKSGKIREGEVERKRRRKGAPLAANGRRRKGGGRIVGEEVGGDRQQAAGDMRSRKSGEKEEKELDGHLEWEATRGKEQSVGKQETGRKRG